MRPLAYYMHGKGSGCVAALRGVGFQAMANVTNRFSKFRLLRENPLKHELSNVSF